MVLTATTLLVSIESISDWLNVSSPFVSMWKWQNFPCSLRPTLRGQWAQILSFEQQKKFKQRPFSANERLKDKIRHLKRKLNGIVQIDMYFICLQYISDICRFIDVSVKIKQLKYLQIAQFTGISCCYCNKYEITIH